MIDPDQLVVGSGVHPEWGDASRNYDPGRGNAHLHNARLADPRQHPGFREE
jgi:hypothetical protein